MGLGLNAGRLGRLASPPTDDGRVRPFPAFWDFANDNYRTKDGNTQALTTGAYTRAGSGWAESQTGIWSEFFANVLRRTDRGVTVEPARTNAIRNNSMQGAAAGSPGTLPTNWSLTLTGGLSSSVVAVDTLNGMDRIRVRIQGTTTNTNQTVFAFESTTGVAAATGQTWTESLFLAINNTTNIFFGQLTVTERTSAGGFVTQGGDPQNPMPLLTTTPQRFLYTYTTSGGGTVAAAQPRFAIGFQSAGLAVDFTLDICWPQMEQGASASTPIRTAGTAGVRNADTLPLKAPWDAYDLLFTFSDNTTQSVPQLMGDYTVPTSLNRPTIKRVDALRTDPTKCLFVVGDSIGRGDGGSAFWYAALAASYTPTRPYKNVAVGGQNSSVMYDGVRTDTAHKDWTWIVCDGRPNTGEAAATVIQNYKDIIASVTAGGGRVFVAPVLPMSPGGGTDPLASVVSAINAALLSDPAFTGKTMGSTPQADYLAALNDDTKRTGDFVHVNDAGQALQATHFRTALDALGY